MFKIMLAKVLTVKIAAAAAATAAAGGIALAAASGNLPAERENTPQPPSSSQVVDTKRTDASGTPGAANKDKNDKDKTKDNGASPSPSLEGLCHAYTAGAGSDHGKALENPAFSALITAAGGEDKVSTYCVDLLGDKAGKPSADHPTGKPSELPTPSKPDEAHPTGGPSTRPGR